MVNMSSPSVTCLLPWFLLLNLVISIFVICVNCTLIHLPLKRVSKAVSYRENNRIRRHTSVPKSTNLNNLEGKPGQGYYIEVLIGSPPQKLNVLVDTGSSNFAVAAESFPDISVFYHRKRSNTYREIGTTVNVPYTQGKWEGVLGTDLVSLTSMPNVTARSNIACITEADNFFINGSNWQGILGFAYAEIARPDSSVEPFFDTVVKSNNIPNKFSLQLCGAGFNGSNPNIDMGGTMLLGGIDQSMYSGPMFYTPIHKPWYYEVIIVDIKVDNKSLAMDCKEYNFGKTIVDSGTTNLRLPIRVFNAVVKAVKAKVMKSNLTMPTAGMWKGDDVLCWQTNLIPYNDFPMITLTFPINKNSSFELVVSPQQYLRAVGEENDESPDTDCFKFAVASSDTGTVIGAVIMEGYTVLFDRENLQIGFAETTCAVRDPKAAKSVIRGPLKYTGNFVDCAYVKPDTEPSKTLNIVAYVMAGVCGVCVIPLFIMFFQWQCRRCRRCRKPKFRRSDSDINNLVEDR